MNIEHLPHDMTYKRVNGVHVVKYGTRDTDSVRAWTREEALTKALVALKQEVMRIRACDVYRESKMSFEVVG